MKSTGKSVLINLPKTASIGEMQLEWKIPKWSNTLERDRARAYFIAYAAAMALSFVERALDRVYRGDVKIFEDFKVPDEAIGCGFHEAVRGVLSHHLVIRDGKIANYHPYPPTPWNASPRDSYGTPGPYEDAVQGLPIFEENGPGQLQGHRHHAHGAQLRPVPAVRRAHVRRARQDPGAVALADAGRQMMDKAPPAQPKPSPELSTPRRSTGINARGRAPIDPRMPTLTPA